MCLRYLGIKMGNIFYIYVNLTSLKWKRHSVYSEFARVLFPVENTNNIKIKVANYRGDVWIRDRILLMNACWVCQSVSFQVFNAASDILFKNKMFNPTHFMPLVSFYTPWKHQKTRGFLFSGGIEREQCHVMN